MTATVEKIGAKWRGSAAAYIARLEPLNIHPVRPERLPLGHKGFTSVREFQESDGRIVHTIGWIRIYEDDGEIVVHTFDNTTENEVIFAYFWAESCRVEPDSHWATEGFKSIAKGGKSGRPCRTRYMAKYVLDDGDLFAASAKAPQIWRDKSDWPSLGTSAVVTFAEAIGGADFVDGFQSKNAAIAAGWILNSAMTLNSRALVTLAWWANSKHKCTVVITADETEVAPGYAVVCDVNTDSLSRVTIAGSASRDRVLAELWSAAELFNKINGPFWFGPPIEPHQPWCSGEHRLEPHADCFATVGSIVPEGTDEHVLVVVSRPRIWGQWDGQALVSIEGDIELLTPAETAQLAKLMVRASDIAAGLYVAASVDGDRQVA